MSQAFGQAGGKTPALWDFGVGADEQVAQAGTHFVLGLGRMQYLPLLNNSLLHK